MGRRANLDADTREEMRGLRTLKWKLRTRAPGRGPREPMIRTKEVTGDDFGQALMAARQYIRKQGLAGEDIIHLECLNP